MREPVKRHAAVEHWNKEHVRVAN